MKIFKYSCLIFLLIFVSGCTSTTATCKNNDRNCLKDLMLKHITRTKPFWEKYFINAMNERVYIAPVEVLEYLALDNRLNGFPEKPTTATPTKNFLHDVKTAIDEIPEPVKQLLRDKFAGVFLVNQLGGSGFTDYITDKNGDHSAAFVVLDARVLQQRTANEWATWKESTPFKQNSTFKIEAIIETEHNNRKNAIQYILLHELGHVISANERFHPSWLISPDEVDNIENYTFFNQSWRIDQQLNDYISKFDDTTFKQRKNVVYYLGAKLSGDQMLNTYNELENTNFTTLYAAVHPADDWAESFVTYVHSVLMKKPFQINIKKNKEIIKTFELCWGTKRCEEKEEILSNLLTSKKQTAAN